MASDGSGLLVIERILRDRHSIWQQVVEERELNALTGRMLAASAIALACYGAVLGAFHSFLMALTSAVKLPLLFLVTLAICLPTLYLFNLVFGARLSIRQALAMVMVAITVISMLAVAFAPISLFFLITAPDYSFFKLLNVAILTLSAFVGLKFLTGGMQVLNEHGLLTTAPPQQVPQQVPAQVPAGAAEVTAPAVPVPATVAANGDGRPQVAAPVPVAAGPAPVAAPVAPQLPRTRSRSTSSRPATGNNSPGLGWRRAASGRRA